MTRRLCTVCARGGSKAVPGKNKRPLLGRPLIHWTIQQAIDSRLFETVAVSSDDAEIIDLALASGAQLAIRRPDELATDTAGKLPAIHHALVQAEAQLGQFEVLVDLDATSPLRTIEDIAGAVAMLESEGRTNVITGTPSHRSPYFNMVERSSGGALGLVKSPESGVLRRQDAPATFDMNASIYVWRAAVFRDTPALFFPDTGLFEMPPERSHDIDNPADFEIVELLLRQRLRSAGGRDYRGYHDLSGKIALVTGGAGILGQHCCAALASHGARVIVADISLDAASATARRLSDQFGPPALGIALDVGNPDAVRTTIARLEADVGPIEILHNNAASKGPDLARFFDTPLDFDPAIWREIMAVNVDGYFYVAREIGARMAERGHGSIIQTASIYGVVGPDQRIYEGSEYQGRAINTPAVYSASKAAVVGLTKYLATYWGHAGVRVNTLTPGGIQSGQNDVFERRYSARVPLGRMGAPEDIANALAFLASDASGYVTGQNLIVDGGLTAW